MEQITNQKKLRPWMGVVMQAFFLLLFITAGAWMQRSWGIPGLVGSELMFAVAAVLYCLIRKVKLSEMFPVKKISVRDFFGVLFMAAGGILLSMIMLGISILILPRSYLSEATGLSDFLYKDNTLPVLLVVGALLPAICEESMERGCVISHFRSIKKDWVIALIMGLFFGIMHMSVLRFLTTASLGFLLSYIMSKKNNILIPMMMHFFNNAFAVTVGALSSGVDASAVENINGVTTLGAYLVIGFACPLLITIGLLLLDPEGHKWYRFVVAGCLSLTMLVSGMGLVVVSAMQGGVGTSLVTSTGSYTVKEAGEAMNVNFDVKVEKSYEAGFSVKDVKKAE